MSESENHPNEEASDDAPAAPAPSWSATPDPTWPASDVPGESHFGPPSYLPPSQEYRPSGQDYRPSGPDYRPSGQEYGAGGGYDQTYGQHYGWSQPTGGWQWAPSSVPPPPPAPGTPGGPYGTPPPNKRGRAARRTIAGLAIVAAAAAGIGVGHAIWPGSTTVSNTASQAPAGSSGVGSGSGSSGFGGSGGSSGYGGGFGGSGSSGTGTGSSGTGTGGTTSSASGSPSDVSAISAKVTPGLVDINVDISYAGEEAAGTGMVLTSKGEVLTNNHVIDGATSISVTDLANSKTYTATVVGYSRTNDVAVLQLQNASGLQTVTLGDSSKASVGQAVVGIGNAGGTGGTPSAAGGAITALNQNITATDSGSDTSEQLTGLIGTDANIEPGDSGGPLVNASGQVLGIDTAGSSDGSSGFSVGGGVSSSATDGYAIPINTAITIAKEIEAGTSSSTVHVGGTAFIGVEFSETSSTNGGNVPIYQVESGTPAEQAGLEAGDTITSLNGQTVSSPTQLATLLVPLKPDQTVQIGYTDQSGASHTVSLKLASGPPA